MKSHLFLLPFAVVLSWTASAQVNIPLLNPGFEEDSLSCVSGCAISGISGWLYGPGTGVHKPSAAEYPNGIPGGVNVAGLGLYGSVTGSILQVAPAVIRVNTTYVLKLSVGATTDNPFSGYSAALMAGNVVLAYDDSLSPVPGMFLEDVIVYKSGSNPPQLGRALQVFIKSRGFGQVDIDNVSLTAITE